MIAGLFAKSFTAGAKATIVLGHPMGKEAKGYFLKHGYTDLLRSNGFNTLVFDMNGFGESTQGNFSFHEDILAIGKKVKDLTPGLPIGYHGISLSGQMATIAFANPSHNFDFAIIESAATTLDEFWANYPFAYGVLKIFNLLLPKYKRSVKMIERIKEAKNLHSILYIYSSADSLTPPEMGKRFAANTPVACELWIVETAKHGAIMKSGEKPAYQEKIIDYFNQCCDTTKNNNRR